MATVNNSRWLQNLGGSPQPLIVFLGVAAGSSAVIKRGDILTVSAEAASVASAGSTQLVVADEEQKAADVARTIACIVPREDDVFEYPLDTARAVKFGETFGIGTDNQHLAYATSNVCFRAWAQSNMPLPTEKSVTRRTVGTVRGCFAKTVSFAMMLFGNS